MKNYTIVFSNSDADYNYDGNYDYDNYHGDYNYDDHHGDYDHDHGDYGDDGHEEVTGWEDDDGRARPPSGMSFGADDEKARPPPGPKKNIFLNMLKNC